MEAVGQEVVFFTTPARLRAWLEKHHATKAELWVGFHKKASGKPSITWPEAVDEATCFGWIDGVRRSVDETSYANRFTPRKPTSTWSARNTRRAKELIKEGRMRPAGLAAFERRTPDRSGTYSYEQRGEARFSPDQARRFRANRAAWTYFQSRAEGYRRTATWWVVSAKREETRQRRLQTLIEDSAQGRSIGPLRRN
jgi:uncharacterized protein YdeI (YjbR/CyaY-like superfamily)